MEPPDSRLIKTTKAELLAMVATLMIISILALPILACSREGQTGASTVNKGRQILLAAFQMAIDGEEQKDKRLGWPGELASRDGGDRVDSVKGYMERLMDFEYLRASDVIKLCAAPGITPWDGKPGTFDGDRNMAFKIYKVTDHDGPRALFAVTKNYVYSTDLTENSPAPYKGRGFVVIRKGGDGAAYRKDMARNLETVGLLPGRRDSTENPIESQSDFLLQK